MYTGHIGVALGAKGLRQSIPLWFLIFASQLPDWADAGLCLAEVRTPFPGMYSHSLPAVATMALAAAVIYCVIQRDAAGMMVVAAVVISHVLADYLTGIKPTWAGGPVIGLQLYRRPVIDFFIESLVVLAGWSIYRSSLALEKRSKEPVFTLLFVLIAIQIGADIVLTTAKGLRKC
jgi:hypothetical protein